MTVAAVDAVIADVVLVTELDWLLTLDVRAGVPARSVDLGGDEQSGDQNKYSAEDCGARQIVCAVTENLWHRRRRSNLRFRSLHVSALELRLSTLLNVTASYVLRSPATLSRSQDFFKPY